ncbi:hypothetical protein C8J56DRAFT_1135555 [Mycena floridula]|nr:hypothetical protein C8J56DRAFT_1135555 [Mycena floridula]
MSLYPGGQSAENTHCRAWSPHGKHHIQLKDVGDWRRRSRTLAPHSYDKNNGLLTVNGAGKHPIFELIDQSEKAWASKLSRASTDLREAVAEYRRRYHRAPPRGFENWWKYVQDHQVQLPDEYDQIFMDIEPFWGIPPARLQSIQRDWEAHADSFTVGKDAIDDSISLLNSTLPNPSSRQGLAAGAFMLMDLLEDVQQHIPRFRAVFSPHDNPNLLTDFKLKKLATDAASQGTVMDHRVSTKLDGWISACDPSSLAWRTKFNWENPPRKPRRRQKTFIHDHRKAMDLCGNPRLLQQHGQFLSHKKGPVPHSILIPQFSYGPTMLHHDITTAMPHNFRELSRSDDLDWDEKTDERLHWRGSNTGIWHADESFWRSSHRIRMMEWAHQGYDSNITILQPESDRTRSAKELACKSRGNPIACPPDVCEKLKQKFEFRKAHSWREAGNYKYILDRLISSRALVFKATIYPEWFTDRIQPWVHFVPVQVDLDHLWDALVFFRGDLNGVGQAALAKRLAMNGREWSLKFWRMEDLTAYMFRLLLEYSRVMNIERESMVFDYREPS